MTREEEIKCASKDYVNYLLDKQEYHNEDYTEYDIRQAFEAGAKWADETMIENACKWLIEQKEMIGISFQEDFIERFKMAMKKGKKE